MSVNVRDTVRDDVTEHVESKLQQTGLIFVAILITCVWLEYTGCTQSCIYLSLLKLKRKHHKMSESLHNWIVL